jgi:short-subunit dehydrogenase
MKHPKHILITGASSGLGHALAMAYAKQGITLSLTGRNDERLQEVVALCQAAGAEVNHNLIDVTDTKTLEVWIQTLDRKQAIDLVIANAGISAGTGGEGESDSQARKLFAVNLDGVMNTIHPAIACMRPRRNGQIAVMSSLAGYRGLPSSPAYSASKAAVRIYGEALRGHLQKEGIHVNVITPGYIKTPMTDLNPFPMPFIMDAEKAAAIIKRKLSKNCARIAFPWPLYTLIWLISCLPPGLTDPIFSRLPSKPSEPTNHA